MDRNRLLQHPQWTEVNPEGRFIGSFWANIQFIRRRFQDKHTGLAVSYWANSSRAWQEISITMQKGQQGRNWSQDRSQERHGLKPTAGCEWRNPCSDDGAQGEYENNWIRNRRYSCRYALEGYMQSTKTPKGYTAWDGDTNCGEHGHCVVHPGIQSCSNHNLVNLSRNSIDECWASHATMAIPCEKKSPGNDADRGFPLLI